MTEKSNQEKSGSPVESAETHPDPTTGSKSNPRTESSQTRESDGPDSPGNASAEDVPVQTSNPEDKAKEYWEQLVRVTADFDNFKKRVARERSETAKYANRSLLQSLLPVLDNLESAVLAAEQGGNESGLQSLKEGVSMVSQQLRTVLQESGLSEVDARGQTFDPNFHEAVSQAESREVPEGQVLQQLRKGYTLHDRLLRPATVVVAKAPEDSSEPHEESSSARTAS